MKALEAVAEWPARTAALAVVGPDLLERVGPDEPLRWASVTKLVTAVAVLIAVERDEITLRDAAGPRGATVRHLLAHASGIEFDGDTVLAQPGRRRIYSNRGFEIVADLVAERTGTPFPEYLRETVLDPLGMTGTRLTGSPARGASGPLSDLVRFARELLAPTLAPGLRDEATRTAFPGLPGVLPGFGRQAPNDWGLGFEIRDGKRPHWTGSRNSPATFGHFGQSGTFLWVDPEHGLACACLTDEPFADWAAHHWPRVSDLVIEEYAGMTRTPAG
jgi:CubicO group peptidase (beta-lactamase class C family)